MQDHRFRNYFFTAWIAGGAMTLPVALKFGFGDLWWTLPISVAFVAPFAAIAAAIRCRFADAPPQP